MAIPAALAFERDSDTLVDIAFWLGDQVEADELPVLEAAAPLSWARPMELEVACEAGIFLLKIESQAIA